jgi:DNA-binding response OmpR family regulator
VNILVIDDEIMILEMLQKAFGRLHFNVDIAENATNGISKFDHGAYDLVITDVRMPGVDGNTIVHHIRQSNRESTPVIGVSGTPWLLQNSDFNEVLDKPFSLKTLIEKAKVLTRT